MPGLTMTPKEEAEQLLREYEEAEGSTTYMLNEKRVDALKTCNHSTLASMDEQIVKDSEPLYNMIDDLGEKAFNLIQDEQGQDVYVCSNEHAVIWVYANEKPSGVSATDSHSGPTVEFGMMTANGGQAMASVLDKLWDLKKDIALSVLAMGIGVVVGKRISGALAKRAAEAAEVLAAGIARDDAYKALRAAQKSADLHPERLPAAIEKLKNARSNVNNLWLKNIPKGGIGEKLAGLATRFPKLTSWLGGTIVTIAATIAFELLWPLISKDLFINMRIYNWDTRPWEVDDWYHDNGILVGGGDFHKQTVAGHTRNIVKTPWGDRLGKWRPVEQIEYKFQNSFTVLDGVGIALRARTVDKNNAISMGYLCSFIKDNQLTVREDYPQSIKDWYWDNSHWPTNRPLQVECWTFDGGHQRMKVTASTNALSGKKDGTYNYIVNIGEAGGRD